LGGAGGALRDGDNGAFSGENGNCLAPGGGTVSGGQAGGGGAPNTAGPAGTITIRYYS
jgi:hypothetical protein